MEQREKLLNKPRDTLNEMDNSETADEGGGSGMVISVKCSPFKAYMRKKIMILKKRKEHHEQRIQYLRMIRQKTVADIKQFHNETQLLLEPASYVCTVVNKVNERQLIVKTHGSVYIVETDRKVDIGQRVAIHSQTFRIRRVLSSVADPLIKAMVIEQRPDVTFSMIGGLQKQINLIREVIELPMINPEVYDSVGITPPKGVLLYGPPGTGKTMLVRAIANHTKSTFIAISATEFIQRFIGEGSRLVREMFTLARVRAPSIIFMDEIDAIGSVRTANGKCDAEVQRTMMELLAQLDGFCSDEKIRVIMATNRIDILDPALLRPGRIDRKIELPPPDDRGRMEILEIYTKKMNIAAEVNLYSIAQKFPGANGAELKALCTEAGIMAIRENRSCVCQRDFEVALQKVMANISQSGQMPLAAFK